MVSDSICKTFIQVLLNKGLFSWGGRNAEKLYELEREFKSDVQNGLTDEQIAENREQYGKNALEEKRKPICLLNS